MIHIHKNEKSSMSWPTLCKGIWKWHCLYNNWHTLNAKTHTLISYYNLFLYNLIWSITKKNSNQSQIRKDINRASCSCLKLNTNLNCNIQVQINRCWPKLTVPIHKTALMSALAFPCICYQILKITKQIQSPRT